MTKLKRLMSVVMILCIPICVWRMAYVMHGSPSLNAYEKLPLIGVVIVWGIDNILDEISTLLTLS